MSHAALWILGLVALGIDGLVWGLAACLLHRWLRGRRGSWLGPALLAGLVFVVWDQWVFSELVHWAGMPRVHAEPARLVEVVMELGATLAGFRGGRALLTGILRREGVRPSAGSARSAPRGGA